MLYKMLNSQGFVQSKAVLLPLFSLIILIVFCKDHQRNLFVGFLYFEKAFDYVSKAKLINNLMAKGKSYVRALSCGIFILLLLTFLVYIPCLLVTLCSSTSHIFSDSVFLVLSRFFVSFLCDL